jgi:hypothetical protein
MVKLFEPFSGYRLASGHAVLHLAFFLGSFAATFLALQHIKEDKTTLQLYEGMSPSYDAYIALRWAHCAVFMLAVLSYWCNMPSEIKETREEPRAQINEEDGSAVEQESSVHEIVFRDQRYKLVARFADTIAVFLYQTVIFYAQFTLFKFSEAECIAADGQIDTSCRDVMYPYTLWLTIETVSFYAYMTAAVVYIAAHMINSEFTNEPISDMKKGITDFLRYAEVNLNWYAFNFVLIILPPILIFKVYQSEDPIHHHENSDGSYAKLMYWLWAMHIA